MIDHRSGVRAPGGTGRGLVEFGGVVADEFEGVAALDQADALIDQALELDRLDLGAVLLGLAAALRLLVAVELALDAVELAVEQVDERPQEIGEIVLEAGAGQHGAQRFDRIVELGLHGIGFGQWPRIGFVLAGAIAVEGQLVEQMRGRRGGGKFGIGVAVPRIKSGDRLKGRGCRCVPWRVPFCRRISRADRGLHGDPLAGGGDGLHPRRGRRRAEDGAGQLFCFALQSRADRGLPMFVSVGRSARRRKIVGRRHCNPASPPANRRSGRPHARLFSG